MSGLNLGENARALLITKGWAEIIKLSEALGADVKSFLGLAGIGDIIATCSSPNSRNYSVGYRLAKGETITDIRNTMKKRAEEMAYTFPYLFDATQQVAKDFGATRTPHVYVLKNNNGKFTVEYIGAIDDNTDDPNAVTAKYVEGAIEALKSNQIKYYQDVSVLLPQ